MRSALRRIFRLLPVRLRVGLRSRALQGGAGDDAVATVGDVRWRYRLLLGRTPDSEGLQNYSTAVAHGMTRRDLVAAFVTSPEFKNRGLAAGIQSGFEQVDVGDLRIWVSSEDWAVGRIVLETRSYEGPVTDLLCGLLEPGGVFVDVGANIGWFSLHAAKAVGPQGTVFAFEPSAQNCALLMASAQDSELRNVNLRPMALGSEPGLLMYDSKASNGETHAVPNLPLERMLERTLVPASTLDRELADVDRVDVIKIDVEGFEAEVLAGADKVIERCQPVLVFEYSPSALQARSGCSPTEFLQTMTRRGYQLGLIQDATAEVRWTDDPHTLHRWHHETGLAHSDVVALPAGHARSNSPRH